MKPSMPDLIPTDELRSGSRWLLAICLVGMLASILSGPGLIAAAAAAKQPGIAAPALSWQMMRGLDFRTGEVTPELQGVINGIARVPGYMVPLEDNLEEVTEFLLVPTPGACIHVPPPPPNQIVHVIMEGNKKAQVRLWMEAVWVEGMLRLAEATTREGAVSYFQLTGTLIQSYKEGK
jgi:uncharacterized protein